MEKFGNYISGNWITGDGDGSALCNSVTGEAIVTATSKGFSSFQ